jgi:hypothetical protein
MIGDRTMSFIFFTPDRTLFGSSDQDEYEGGTCDKYGEEVRCIQVMVRKPEGKRTIGRPKHRSEYNVKMNIKNRTEAWIDLVQDSDKLHAFVNAVMNLQVE